jgi:hypothetical protein
MTHDRCMIDQRRSLHVLFVELSIFLAVNTFCCPSNSLHITDFVGCPSDLPSYFLNEVEIRIRRSVLLTFLLPGQSICDLNIRHTCWILWSRSVEVMVWYWGVAISIASPDCGVPVCDSVVHRTRSFFEITGP